MFLPLSPSPILAPSPKAPHRRHCGFKDRYKRSRAVIGGLFYGMEDELICSQWPGCTGQNPAPGWWVQSRGPRCTVAGAGAGAVAGGGLAARTELLARAGTVLTQPLTTPPLPQGKNATSCRTPSPPSSAEPPQGGAPRVHGTRGLNAWLSVSRRGRAALARRTRPAEWSLEARA